MFDPLSLVLRQTIAHTRMRRYAATRAEIDALEARAARELGDVIEAYEWLDEIPEPDRPDAYKASTIFGRSYGEDLVGELMTANRCSQGSAQMLVGEVSDLMHDMPSCWAQVTDPDVRAPLWQARRIVTKCAGLDHDQLSQVDSAVSLGLGSLGWDRLCRSTLAAIKRADPNGARLKAKEAGRYVRIDEDLDDSMTAYVSARLDRAAALRLDDTIGMITARMVETGAGGTVDERRAAALGMLADPAQVMELIGGAPATTVVFRDRTQLYVHVYQDCLGNPDEIARVEGIGPVLLDQVKNLTAGSQVTVSRVIDTTASVAVDSYEIPDRIREQVLAAHAHVIAPWSSMESRHQDLDHIVPYESGIPNQTRATNLAPQSRGSHRWKTVAGWTVDIVWPGAYRWTTAAGQKVLVDQLGTHLLRDRE